MGLFTTLLAFVISLLIVGLGFWLYLNFFTKDKIEERKKKEKEKQKQIEIVQPTIIAVKNEIIPDNKEKKIIVKRKIWYVPDADSRFKYKPRRRKI